MKHKQAITVQSKHIDEMTMKEGVREDLVTNYGLIEPQEITAKRFKKNTVEHGP